MKPQNKYRFIDRLSLSFYLIALRFIILLADLIILVLILVAWIPMLLMKKRFYTDYLKLLKITSYGRGIQDKRVQK